MKEPGGRTEPGGRLATWLFRLGAAGLLFAMASDAIAVLGRHIGIPLLGSIELVQAAILVASSAAMLSATLADKHAVVHLLMDRLPAGARAVLQRIHALLCMLFFAALGVGSIWIAAEMRGGHEQSELLGIPFAPLRLISIVAVLAVAFLYLMRALRRPRP